MNQTEEYSSGDFDENTPIHQHHTKGSSKVGKASERVIKEVVTRGELSVSPGRLSNQVGGGTSPMQAVITT
jgi:hypothetical protein